MLRLAPRSASAIQLHWSDGTASLTFTQATRCTLVVQADSAEQRLPAEWRLLWVADSTTQISPVALGQPTACLESFAQMSALDPPGTAADSAAHLLTAHFCSDESEPPATVGRYVLDLPGGGAGRLKVVALDPNDSTQVIESGEVTFNGGVAAEYQPVILRATSYHQSIQLEVTATGAGLSNVQALTLTARDSSWTLPLAINARTGTSVTAVGSVAALLPACQVAVVGAEGASSSTPLDADAPPVSPLSPQSFCFSAYTDTSYRVGDTLRIQPKDFAFVPGGFFDSSNNYVFHLFYIRQDTLIDRHRGGRDSTERTIGHAVTNDFNTWVLVDTAAIRARPGRFDHFHVWAPSIVRNGPYYFMFYTGVDALHDQSIGVATSTDLTHWTQDTVNVFSASRVPWADPKPDSSGSFGLYYGQQQFRDPFVLQNPNDPSKWLMYFTSVARIITPRMAIGVARSNGNLRIWNADPVPLGNTEWPAFPGVVESPHTFQRNGQWWLPYTVNGDQIYFGTNTASPTDSTAGDWGGPVQLRSVVYDSAPMQFWHASEYLQITTHEYLTAWDDLYQSIDFIEMGPAAPPDSFSMACPNVAAVGGGAGGHDGLVHLRLAGVSPAHSRVGLGIDVPARMRVRLAIFDVMGRRVRTLLDGEIPAGITPVTWDGRSAGGAIVGSGVYFIRLSFTGGQRLVRVPLLR